MLQQRVIADVADVLASREHASPYTVQGRPLLRAFRKAYRAAGGARDTLIMVESTLTRSQVEEQEHTSGNHFYGLEPLERLGHAFIHVSDYPSYNIAGSFIGSTDSDLYKAVQLEQPLIIHGEDKADDDAVGFLQHTMPGVTWLHRTRTTEELVRTIDMIVGTDGMPNRASR